MIEYIDHILLFGIALLALSFPTMVGAFSRGAPPRAAMLTIFAGGVMILYANSARPGGYSIEEVPQVLLRVFGGA